jgi:hypothetical protein
MLRMRAKKHVHVLCKMSPKLLCLAKQRQKWVKNLLHNSSAVKCMEISRLLSNLYMHTGGLISVGASYP